jgi:hypothetical protein
MLHSLPVIIAAPTRSHCLFLPSMQCTEDCICILDREAAFQWEGVASRSTGCAETTHEVRPKGAELDAKHELVTRTMRKRCASRTFPLEGVCPQITAAPLGVRRKLGARGNHREVVPPPEALSCLLEITKIVHNLLVYSIIICC